MYKWSERIIGVTLSDREALIVPRNEEIETEIIIMLLHEKEQSVILNMARIGQAESEANQPTIQIEK